MLFKQATGQLSLAILPWVGITSTDSALFGRLSTSLKKMQVRNCGLAFQFI